MILLQIPAFKKIEAEAQSTHNCISFAQGALRVGGVPEQIREYVQEMIKTDKADYYGQSLGLVSLRERIAHYLTTTYKAPISLNRVFISHGSMGGLSTLFLSLLNPGDEVILPSPTYPVYANAVKLAKATPVFVDSFYLKRDEQGESQWAFDFERIKNSITAQSKMIVIPNPSNPLGVCFTEQQLLALKDLCESNKIYFVSDEVYENYVFEGNFYSAVTFVPDSDYVFRVGSFSKNFAMSGWRVGFVVTPPQYMDTFSAVQSATVCCPTVISQYAALYALDHSSLMDSQIKTIKENREIVIRELTPLVERNLISFAKPQATFYLFVKTMETDSNLLVMDILHRFHVALAPGKDFGPGYDDCFRLCFARDQELVKHGVERLVRYFDTLHLHKPLQPHVTRAL